MRAPFLLDFGRVARAPRPRAPRRALGFACGGGAPPLGDPGPPPRPIRLALSSATMSPRCPTRLPGDDRERGTRRPRRSRRRGRPARLPRGDDPRRHDLLPEVRRRCKKDELQQAQPHHDLPRVRAGHGVRGQGAQAALLHRSSTSTRTRRARTPGDGELVRRAARLRRAGQAPLLGERVGERVRGAREAAVPLRVSATPRRATSTTATSSRTSRVYSKTSTGAGRSSRASIRASRAARSPAARAASACTIRPATSTSGSTPSTSTRSRLGGPQGWRLGPRAQRVPADDDEPRAEFTYYFISFRCCADAAPDPAGGAPPWTPPPLPKNEKPKGKLFRGWTPN
jgi:hypothetical protein